MAVGSRVGAALAGVEAGPALAEGAGVGVAAVCADPALLDQKPNAKTAAAKDAER